MPDARPLLTIWCPAFNHEKYMAQAIEGFLCQKVNFPIEIVVHDDASTDGTAAIIRDYAARRPDLFRPIFQETNQFSIDRSSLAQTLWRVSRGKYIAMCEGDDYWTDPWKLQKQVDYLENNPAYTMAFHDYVILNPDGSAGKGTSSGSQKSRTDYEMVCGAPAHTSTVTFLKDVPELPPELSRTGNNDTALFAYLCAYRGRGAAYLAGIQPSVYRMHAGGIWSTSDGIHRKRIAIATFFSIRKLVPEKYSRVIDYKILSLKFRLARSEFGKDDYAQALGDLLACMGFFVTRGIFRRPPEYGGV